jgi:hypothetical protein
MRFQSFDCPLSAIIEYPLASSLHQFLQIQGSLDYIADIDSDA